jgi:hypothetical protein
MADESGCLTRHSTKKEPQGLQEPSQKVLGQGREAGFQVLGLSRLEFQFTEMARGYTPSSGRASYSHWDL